MNKSLVVFLLLLLIIVPSAFAQQDTLAVDSEKIIETKTEKERDFAEYDPLAPARAAFYSAVLPGLGQAYNKQYWKVPIVYGGLTTGVLFYLNNDKEYDRFRDAFKRRLAGFEDDEFFGQVTNDGLIEAQRFYQRNKEISILVTVGIYILNIVDANVTAHLRQFNISEDLSFEPAYNFDQLSGRGQYGMSLNFKF